MAIVETGERIGRRGRLGIGCSAAVFDAQGGLPCTSGCTTLSGAVQASVRA